jgi:hypothetical protein
MIPFNRSETNFVLPINSMFNIDLRYCYVAEPNKALLFKFSQYSVIAKIVPTLEARG